MRLIDADALKVELCKEYRHFGERTRENFPVFRLLRDAPSLEADLVKLKHGRWEDKPHKMMGECPRCSLCGSFNPIKYRYCPNCGARMDEVDDETD